MRTASKAGSGGPDVVQLEYQFISSFAQTGDLLDLTPYGAADIAERLRAMGLEAGRLQRPGPGDSAGLGSHGQPVPRRHHDRRRVSPSRQQRGTDYKTAAEKVRANTDSYISNMAPGQGAGWLGLLWQAGVKPFGYDGGKNVTINVNSPEAKKVMAYWQDMIQNDLVSVDPDFNDEWYAGLNPGKYAGWLTAAWAPVFLSGAAKDTSGKWRAAPLPQWDASKPASGNQGGSADAVLKTSKNPIAAYELAKWINNAHDPALLFAPSSTSSRLRTRCSTDPAFVDDKPDFYGGQKVNELFAQISTTVDPDWQWLPFMEFAYSSCNDTFGAAVAAKGDLGCGAGCLAEPRSSTTRTSRASRSTSSARAARGSTPGPPPPNHHVSEGTRDDQCDQAEAAPRCVRIRPPVLRRVRGDAHRTARLLGLPELLRAPARRRREIRRLRELRARVPGPRLPRRARAHRADSPDPGADHARARAVLRARARLRSSARQQGAAAAHLLALRGARRRRRAHVGLPLRAGVRAHRRRSPAYRAALTEPALGHRILFSIMNIITWAYVGYNMIIMYSALKSIPAELYEAAEIDGASQWRLAWSVKIPLIRPAILLTVIFSVIGSFQIFNEPSLLLETRAHRDHPVVHAQLLRLQPRVREPGHQLRRGDRIPARLRHHDRLVRRATEHPEEGSVHS